MTHASDFLIPLADGTRLAASLLLPEGDRPFPLLATFYPYRKDDFIGASCAFARQYFADVGYATLLVDIRGYGGSDGPACQAWDPREAKDGAEVVQWAAAQDWCDGQVAVWGTSYGGAQSLAIAAERPPALKAIASIYGAADIYEDFVYPGGCPNGLGASAWSAFVVALELAPPGLQDSEGRWLDAWRDRLARLESGSISSLVWPAHTTFDEYWQERVIPVEQIEVPSFFLSGWRDLLCRGTLESYARCRAPKRLLAGPWTHAAPDGSAEAPYDWLLELRQWFDQWMKSGAEVPDRPDVVFRLQGPETWHAADRWPPAHVAERRFYAAEAGAAAETPAALRVEYEPEGLVGTEAGLWFPMGVVFPNVLDQAADDAKSLAFTSAPLAADLDILGAPRAHLEVEFGGGARAHLCVKLCHVSPDDRSTLISSGWLRVDPEQQPRASVDILLYPTAYRIPAGHRLRWTLACADFPRIWPSATLPTLALLSDPGRPSAMTVPVSTLDPASLPTFAPPLPEPGLNRAPWVVAGRPIYEIQRDVAGKAVAITAGMDATLKLPQGGSFQLAHTVTARMAAARPSAATIRTRADMAIELASGERFTIEASGLSALGRRHLHGRILSDNHVIFERRWSSFNGREATSLSSPAFAGEGDHAQHGGGDLSAEEGLSTELRAIPLPR
jgi:putative CocE/NonD family hydrolase